MRETQALRGLLGAQAAITAIFNERMYPGVAAQGEQLPHLVFFTVSTENFDCKGTRGDLHRHRMQIIISSKTQEEAESGAQAVIENIERKSGTFNGEIITDVTLEGERGGWNPSAKTYQKDIDIFLFKRA